jgi:hypothetical protein
LGDEGLAKWYERHMGMKLLELGKSDGSQKIWVIQRRGEGSSFQKWQNSLKGR